LTKQINSVIVLPVRVVGFSKRLNDNLLEALMPKSMTRIVGAVLLALSSTIGADAVAMEFNTTARSGQPMLLYTFFDCRRHSPGGDGGAFAEHGAVTIKDVYQNRCGNPNEQARQAWYTSTPGFKGIDKIVFPLGPMRTLNFNVTVQ
jgi:hypothetical protein